MPDGIEVTNGSRDDLQKRYGISELDVIEKLK